MTADGGRGTADFSAAACGGLIEAFHSFAAKASRLGPFPPPRAAASLKQQLRTPPNAPLTIFSAAACGGLIEANLPVIREFGEANFSAAACGGLIEA